MRNADAGVDDWDAVAERISFVETTALATRHGPRLPNSHALELELVGRAMEVPLRQATVVKNSSSPRGGNGSA